MARKIDVLKAVEWVNQQWKGNKQCPICDSNDWTVNDSLVEVREMADYAPNILPIFTITCNVCGNTIFFNAIIAGLIPPYQPTPASSGPSVQTKSTPSGPPVQIKNGR